MAELNLILNLIITGFAFYQLFLNSTGGLR